MSGHALPISLIAMSLAPKPIVTGHEGFLLWPALLDSATQTLLLSQVRSGVLTAPLYRPVTPSGMTMSVRLTSFGALGWTTDKAGYRYSPLHPVTHQSWPAIPDTLLNLWHQLFPNEAAPDSCLVNFYDADARMGLHQDRDEKDLSAPVLSVSLGDTALFRYGPAAGGATRSVRLTSGDVCALTGSARLMRHGIDRIYPGSSQLLPKGGRVNLTLRRAG